MTDPATARRSRAGFESPWPPAVSQVAVRVWRLLVEMVYHVGDGRILRVPAGQETDWASVPRLLRWALDPMTGAAAALLHDYLWRVLLPAGVMGYREADRILREALLSLRDPETGERIVDRFTAWVMWASVRIGALTRRGGWRDWHRDALPVLGIMLPVSVFLAVPTVVVALFVPFIWLAKWLSR